MTSTRSQKDESRASNGHHTAGATETYEAWQNFYQRMADDSVDFYQKGFENFQKMSPFYPGNELFQSWADNYQEFMKRMGDEMSGGLSGDREAFRRMYEIWLDTWTRNFESYMRTPEFIERSGKDIENYSEFQKKMSEMMEAYWHAIRLPSTHDMREIYQKLYMIERKLDELDRRIRTVGGSSKSDASAKKSK